jgi:hypothetical protein
MPEEFREWKERVDAAARKKSSSAAVSSCEMGNENDSIRSDRIIDSNASLNGEISHEEHAHESPIVEMSFNNVLNTSPMVQPNVQEAVQQSKQESTNNIFIQPVIIEQKQNESIIIDEEEDELQRQLDEWERRWKQSNDNVQQQQPEADSVSSLINAYVNGSESKHAEEQVSSFNQFHDGVVEASAPPIRVINNNTITLPDEAPPAYDEVVGNTNNRTARIETTLNEDTDQQDIPTASVIDESEHEGYYFADALIPLPTNNTSLPTNNLGQFTRGASGNLYIAVAAPLVSNNPAEQQQRQQEDMRNDAASMASQMDRIGGIKRRVILPFSVEEKNGKWYPTITLVQPKLRSNTKSPQGNRPDFVQLGGCNSRDIAMKLGALNSPPLWDGEGDPKQCALCFKPEGFFFKIHHCRNCGSYVCNECSDKSWPSSMLPPAYVCDETNIRVCISCNYLMEGFDDALRNGNAQIAMAFYSSGNVNLHCPLSVYKSRHFAVHSAAQGGNLDLLRWLVEIRRCNVKMSGDSPLETSDGMSVLAIAAYYGHVDIMRYLVDHQGCKVTEIKDLGVLFRGLHAALEVILVK